MDKLTEAPKGAIYDPGKQVDKAKGDTYADTPEKIVKNIIQMVGQNIGGYIYYPTKKEAKQHVKTNDDNLAHEAGLGWYIHSKREYILNPRKKLFGFQEENKNG